MTLAIVKVLPDPVTPSSTWCFSRSNTPAGQCLDGRSLVALRLVSWKRV